MGKPVFNKELKNATYGSWMKDPMPNESNDKIWMTIGETNSLYEYSNKSMFKGDMATKIYNLSFPFYVSENPCSLCCYIILFEEHCFAMKQKVYARNT